MKAALTAAVLGALLSTAAMADDNGASGGNDRASDREHRHHRHQSEHDSQYPQGVTRPGDPNPYTPKVGAPNPYAPKVGAPDPYAPKVGAPNPYATRGGDPNPYATRRRHVEAVRRCAATLRTGPGRAHARASAESATLAGDDGCPRAVAARIRRARKLIVGEEHTAPRVGSGLVHVLATPVMINLFEAAALDAVDSTCRAGYQSLGTVLNVRHIAATPVGMRVRAAAEIRIESELFSFPRSARRKELIGDGTHERVVVNVEKFSQRLQRKLKPG